MSQASPPQPGSGRRWRPALKLWHRWFGLVGGIWLILLAVTGSLITFYDEFDTLLNPDLRRVDPVAVEASVEAMVTSAVAAVPGFQPSHIDLPERPDESVWMIGRAPGADGGPGGVQVFVDPSDARVLGWRESGRVAFGRRYVMDIIYGLHVDLLIAPWVTWAFGLISLLWVIDHAISVVLAVPRLQLWREAFSIGGSKGSLRRLFDLHRAPGLWAFPVTLALAITGVTLAWPEDSREAVRLIAPVSERLHDHWPEVEPPTHPIGIDRAMARVAQRDQIDSVRPLPHSGAYAIRTFDPRDLDRQGRLWTYVAMADGRMLGVRHDAGNGPGDAFFAWQFPLHSGQAFGLFGRILVFLGGIITAMLGVTGVILWLRRGRRLI